jgi:hypothetical protein
LFCFGLFVNTGVNTTIHYLASTGTAATLLAVIKRVGRESGGCVRFD